MSLSVGIVGLPNVGKSTLFNALLKRQAALAANYPFATIEPNVGIVPVPDARLDVLAKIVQTSVIKPATVEFVDIAGLVKGASQGAGLGNQFLSHIRETNLICHVLRAFENDDIIREGSVEPVIDLGVVRTELQLADLGTLTKQSEPKGVTEAEVKKRWGIILQFKSVLEKGEGVKSVIDSLAGETQELAQQTAKELGLLTAKNELFVLNVSEEQIKSGVEELNATFAQKLGESSSRVVVMCNQIESELSRLSDEDQKAYLAELGLKSSGLERLIVAAYQELGLQSFLTAGVKEVRAWTIHQGTPARKAAGVIHTDFERLMISAKVIGYEDFVAVGGWKGAKEKGKLRVEGRDYVMREGDVVEFLIGN